MKKKAKKKADNKITVESVLSSRKCKEEDKLPDVLVGIDQWASDVAVKIGLVLSSVSSWANLGWFFTQYRGTILSGERSPSKFYHRQDFGSPRENRALLHIYWKVYGLGSTIGELFEAWCSSEETSDEKIQRGPPYWHLLNVDLADGLVNGNKHDVLNLELSNSDAKTDAKDIESTRVVHLKIGRELVNALVPGRLWEETKTWISVLAEQESEQAMTKLDSDPRFSRLKALFNSVVQRQVAEIMWQSHLAQTDVLGVVCKFVLAAGDHSVSDYDSSREYALGLLLRSLQLLGLYWLFTKEQGKGAGPLVVCVPKPDRKKGKGLQPRLGFAAMFVNGEGNALQLCRRLIEKWQPALDSAASDILANRGHKIEGKVRNLGSDLLGKDVHKELTKKLALLHPGNDVAANLLLERLLPVLSKVDQLSPSFIHEGHRFAVTILVGLGYHEQVIGEDLGSVEDFISGLELKVPQLSKEEMGTTSWEIPDLLGPLIHSCYALLDWNGVVLFAKFEPDADKMMRFLSLRRLPESIRAGAPSETFKHITRQHAGLFVIAVDRGATIRVYYNGVFLLSKYKGEWKVGSAEDNLLGHIVTTLKGIGVPASGSKKYLRRFAQVLLRISEDPGVGAAFVIGRDKQVLTRLSQIFAPPPKLWEQIRPFDKSCPELREEIFYRLATMDGATAIILGEGATFEEQWNSATVVPRLLMTEKFDIDFFYDNYWCNGKWSGWIEFLLSGSRHNSGLAQVMQAMEDECPPAVILISADGPITFLVGGETPVKGQWP